MEEKLDFSVADHKRLWLAMALSVDFAITKGWAAFRLKDYVLWVDTTDGGMFRPYEDEYACEYHKQAADSSDGEECDCELCPLAWKRTKSAREWRCMGGLYDEFNLALIRKDAATAKRLARAIANLPLRAGVEPCVYPAWFGRERKESENEKKKKK